MKKVLIVVDYQNDFVNGVLGFKKAENLDAGILAKIQEFLRNDDLVLFTYDTHNENYLKTQEGRNLPVEHCIVDTPGWELYGDVGKKFTEIEYADNVTYVTKETFGSNTLMEVLQGTYEGAGYGYFMRHYAFEELGEVHLCGVVTNMCVISNAVIAKAALPEAKIVIHANLCASFVDELHDKALDVMESMQMEVVSR